MNLSADPCEDFSAYACGRFYAEVPIPDDKSRFSAFSLSSNAVRDRGRAILEEEAEDKEGEWDAERKAKMHYK